MPFFPSHSEVLVSSLSKEEVMERLDLVTKDANFLEYELKENQGYQFNGTLSEDSFSLSLVITKADSFLPLIKGKLEATPKGSILFLQYSLFPGTIFFLGFWSVVTVILAIFFAMVSVKYILSGISLAVGIGNYLFAWNHFKRKIRVSQEIFHELLNL
ncbi:hypothetical protein [Cecembia rubra]|uniref:Uncharacterized protein n=1 Tax=Cecembia rubra TaxID=1485585 RepID=A0A2P8DTD9_9BACT|nr:hypothetical protein [Cecembia rubra]PSL00465.1 hypothetical protein CLV48_11517 [Cecembia rubra]